MADPKFSLDPDDYEDVEIDDPENPEMTEEDFAQARPFREVLPELYASLMAEQEVALKLSAETIRAFVAQGEDWRERMAAALDDVASRTKAA